MKKVNPGVFLRFFRLSKIEKRRVSPILDSLKFHSKGHVQLQTGTNHSFLGFEFKLSWTHPKDELIIKHMLSSLSLLKKKGPDQYGWGNWENRVLHLLMVESHS